MVVVKARKNRTVNEAIDRRPVSNASWTPAVEIEILHTVMIASPGVMIAMSIMLGARNQIGY